MLTTKLRRASSPRTLGWLGVLTTLGAALFGCPDALHLDPTSSSSGSSSGSGGGSGAPCNSNPDCSYPTAVCDTEQRVCVECLVVADCMAKPNTVCSKGQCVCAAEGQTFCPGAGQQPGQCVDPMTAQNDCGTCGHACIGGCAAGVCTTGWSNMSTDGAPDARTRHVAVWDDADKLMIVWGGVTQDQKTTATGGVYDLVKNTWRPMSTANAPSARAGAAAVWDDADKKMIVWGGDDSGPLNTGGIYDPIADMWKPLNSASAPSARYQHTAVWAGASMIVWGGFDGKTFFDTGASYNPQADAWTALPPGGPTPRSQHTAVWNGTSMLVWGGFGPDPAMMMMNIPFGDGGSFDAAGMKWDPLTSVGAPSPRSRHTAVWTATAMLVFGGNTGAAPASDGGQYLNTVWSALGVASAPEARQDHTAVWIPATNEMIVFGGNGAKAYLNTGARLNGSSLGWSPIPSALSGRARHTAVTAGAQMIVWGGDIAANTYTNTGGIFDAMAK